MPTSLNVESDYEKREKRWKKIFLFLVVLMIFAFFIFFAHVHSLVEKETPYITESCTFVAEREFISDEPLTEKNVKRVIRKHVDGSYQMHNATFVFDPCMGWKIEMWKNGSMEKMAVACENGKIVIYKKLCKPRDLLSALKELAKILKVSP